MNNMETRKQQLANLKTFREGVENQMTTILQTLQWDTKHLTQGTNFVTCKYDNNHRIPQDVREKHEKECFLIYHGYSKEEELFPDSFVSDPTTLVKMEVKDIQKILAEAAASNPSFRQGSLNRRGSRYQECLPLSANRLRHCFTSDELFAIYEAVVQAAPSSYNLEDLLVLPSNEKQADREKSRLELLAELRDMRRRRAKYRVPAKTSNYSDVLRNVIAAQMELYTGAKPTAAQEHAKIDNTYQNDQTRSDEIPRQEEDTRQFEQAKKVGREHFKDYKEKVDRHDRDRKARHGRSQDMHRTDRRHAECRDTYKHRYDDDYRRHGDRKRDRYETKEREGKDKYESRTRESCRTDREYKKEDKYYSEKGYKEKYKRYYDHF